MLNDNNYSITGDDLSHDDNHAAYDEICDKIKGDLGFHRKVTVKSLLDSFSKKPYGWRDLDIQGMIGVLWKHHKIQIFIHDNEVSENNNGFKNDLVRKNSTDTMVVRIQEKIDEQILYNVKRIMYDVYSENLPLEDTKLKEGVVSFFGRKKDFLSGLKSKYGSTYAGCSAAAEIYKDFDAILSAPDTLSLFNAVIERKQSLEDSAETLEQLEAFYKDGSNQQKNYKDAKDICKWYDLNSSLQDLSRMDDVVQKMKEIIELDMPFKRMNELANLVFQANSLKETILKEKLEQIKNKLETDRDTVSKELSGALSADLTDDQKNRIQAKADEVLKQYESWLDAISLQTPNMDSYVTASENTLKGFRAFISMVMSEGTETPVRSKRIKIIDCVPTVNKKVTSAEELDAVLSRIRQKLIAELENNDEINLE